MARKDPCPLAAIHPTCNHTLPPRRSRYTYFRPRGGEKQSPSVDNETSLTRCLRAASRATTLRLNMAELIDENERAEHIALHFEFCTSGRYRLKLRASPDGGVRGGAVAHQ